MDILSVVGFILAMVAILVGAILKGAGLKALLSAAAFMIVFVGTFASIFIQTPLPVFKLALNRVSWIFRPPAMQAEALIQKIIEWSNIARKQGLLGLEPMIQHGGRHLRPEGPAARGRRLRARCHPRHHGSGD